MTRCHMRMSPAGCSSPSLPGGGRGDPRRVGDPHAPGSGLCEAGGGKSPRRTRAGVRSEGREPQVQAEEGKMHYLKMQLLAGSAERGLSCGRSQMEKAIRLLRRCYRKSINHRPQKLSASAGLLRPRGRGEEASSGAPGEEGSANQPGRGEHHGSRKGSPAPRGGPQPLEGVPSGRGSAGRCQHRTGASLDGTERAPCPPHHTHVAASIPPTAKQEEQSLGSCRNQWGSSHPRAHRISTRFSEGQG